VFVFFVFMTGSYLLLVAQTGIPAFHADVVLRREALQPHHYLVAVLLSSAMTLMLFLAADLWSLKRVLAPLQSGGILGLAAFMLGSFGNRGFLAVPALTLLILWHYWRRPIRMGTLAIIALAAFMASAGYGYQRVRAIRSDWRESAWSQWLYSSAAFTLHTSLSNFRDVVQAIPSEVPYQRGYLTFGALLQILPGHHESSDEFFKRILANDFVGGGQPGSLLAPFYGDFGLGGILMGMFFFGAFSARAYAWTAKSPTLLRVLLYSWLAQTALFSLYGALATYFITLWLPFMWWVLHCWMRTARQVAERGSQGPVRSLRPA
jgi:oligosaccharide repeat unit polymerase